MKESGGTRRLLVFSVLCLLLLASGCGGSASRSSTTSSSNPSPSVTSLSLPDLIARARPSVAMISGVFVGEQYSGSGFVVDAADGLLLTNDHVVSGLANVEVSFNDGRDKSAAVVVAEAPCDDLALIRLQRKPPGLSSLPLGDSKLLRPGDEVIALGYPSSAQSASAAPKNLSATHGAVSTSEQPAEPGPDFPSFQSVIMHEAALNPGDSGGPLLNQAGEVVGVDTFTGGGQGQYYSISVSAVKDALPALKAGKSLDYVGWTVAPLDSVVPQSDPPITYRQYLTSPRHLSNPFPSPVPSSSGLVVLYVDPGSAADKAKFGPGDIITDLDNSPVDSVGSVCKTVASHGRGMQIEVSGYESPSRVSWEQYDTRVTMP